MASRLVLSLILCFLISNISALTTLKGSPCWTACNGGNATTSDDILCTDDALLNTAKGQLLNQCLSCLSKSSYGQGYRTDAFAFLYYNTIVQQSCLIEPTEIPLSYCSTQCNKLDTALTVQLDDNFFQSPYDYCSDSSGGYAINAPSCATCLQSQRGSVIIGNFVSVGVVACMTQPAVWAGENVDFEGDLFDASPLDAAQAGTNTPVTVLATTPTMSASGFVAHPSGTAFNPTSSDSAATVTPPAPTSNSSQPASDDSDGGISRGAAAGVGLVVGLAGIAGIVAFAIYMRKRRRGTFEQLRDAATPEPTQTTGPGIIELPKPMKAWVAGMSPRSSQWYYAANPKKSDDLSALPQRDWR